jgi:ABC-type transporter Mla subunit MlaD
VLLAQDRSLARTVGAITLALLALAIVFFVFVFDRIEWGRHLRVRVYFHDTGGLIEGAPFVVAGRTIGKVEAISLGPRGTRCDGGVVATVVMDAGPAEGLAEGDVFVAARGPLSGKYLELGAAPVGAPLIHEGDELCGRDPPSLDRVLQRTWDNLQVISRFTAELRPEMDALRTQLRELQQHLGDLAPDVQLRADIAALSAEAARTYDALGGGAGIDRMSALAADARATTAQVRAMIATLGTKADTLAAGLRAVRDRLDTRGQAIIDRAALAVERVQAIAGKLDPLLAQVDAITAALARGEGSLMKLANDPEFPEDAKELGKIIKRHPWRVIDHSR